MICTMTLHNLLIKMDRLDGKKAVKGSHGRNRKMLEQITTLLKRKINQDLASEVKHSIWNTCPYSIKLLENVNNPEF
jgi:hypothetical protein